MVDESSETKSQKKKKKRSGRLLVCLANCKYEVVAHCTKEMGWKICGEEDDWTLCWMDFSVSPERVMKMERWQVRFCCPRASLVVVLREQVW